MRNKGKKSISMLLIVALVTVTMLSLVACNGDSLDGTWTRAAGETGGFSSITFDGNNIIIPSVTDVFGDAAGAMGISYIFRIDGERLIISTSAAGVTVEAMRLSFRRDGNSIFVDDIEYVR